jgi:hypothetical protein
MSENERAGTSVPDKYVGRWVWKCTFNCHHGIEYSVLSRPWLYIIPVAPSGILIWGISEWQHYYILVIL